VFVRMIWLMQTKTSKTESTTVVDEHYAVVLEAALDRFEETPFTVRQQVILGDRIVVASASGDGYWWIPADPALTEEGTVPRAVFQPDKSASFTYHPARGPSARCGRSPTARSADGSRCRRRR
jgi:hypothetical protein